MTREEFIRDYHDASISELIDFCNENDIYYLTDDFYSEDSFNDYMDDEIMDYVRNNGWRDAAGFAEGLPDIGYDWYVKDDWGDWVGVNDDEVAYRRDLYENILSDCDDSDFWDYDEDESESPVVDITVPYQPTDEEISFYECSAGYESVLLQ